jgi:hypothetical protein
VPFSYRWFVLRDATVPPVPTPLVVLLILGIGYPVAAWLTAGRFQDPASDPTLAATVTKVALPGLCLLGSAILILPATLISLSAEHFHDVSWGVGYLPVYISYFGVTLLLLAGLAGVMRLVGCVRLVGTRLCPAAAISVGGLLGLAAMVGFSDNARVVERFNVASGAYHREVTQEALQHGLCRDLPRNAQIWLSNRWRWEHEDLTLPFFRTYSGIPVKIVSDGKYRRHCEDHAENFHEAYPEEDNVFYLNHEASSPGEGHVVLANLAFVAGHRTGMRAAGGRHVRIYLRVPPERPHIVVRGRTVGKSPGEGGAAFVVDQNDLKFTARGRDWCIIELPLGDTEIDLLSLQLE